MMRVDHTLHHHTDSRFFVFQTDIQGEDESVLDALGHVWVSRAVIKYKPSDELGFR